MKQRTSIVFLTACLVLSLFAQTAPAQAARFAALHTYTLTVRVSPAAGGTVTKSPDKPAYNAGEIVTLTATPAVGYTFKGWSGGLTGSANPATVTMNQNRTITANFTPIDYTLAITVVGSGTVTKYPNRTTYHYGDSVRLTATAATNWSFAGWSGDVTGAANPVTITINGSKAVTATFAQRQFTLTVATAGSGTVTKNPNQSSYAAGQVVSLTASPAQGWSFSTWSGDLTGSGNPASLTMDSSKSVTATFTQNRYTLAVNIAGQGTVAKSPDQPTYTYGQVVTLTPTPAAGYTFTGWDGACTGAGACAVTMNGDQTVTATFAQGQITLTITSQGSGTVTADPPGPYQYGQVVTLTAAADPGWNFSAWSGDLSGSANPATITMDGSKAATATFTQNAYTLAVNVVGQGTVTRQPDQATYAYGQTIMLTASASAGWSFAGWGGDLSGSANPASITMDGNKTVTATFTQGLYMLTVSISGSGTVSLDNPGPYHYGDVVTLMAAPSPGWNFSGWSDDLSGSANPNTITMDGSKTVTAVFVQNQFTLTVNIVGQGAVTRQPDQAGYTSGSVVQLTAAPAQGWSFAGWSSDLTGNANPASITMDGNKTVTATFTTQQSTQLPKDLIVSPGTLREDFDSLTGWKVSGSASGYAASVDTTNYKVGSGAVKLTTPSSSGYIQIYKTVNWDLSAANEQGNMRLWVYVYGSGDPVDFSIQLSNDTSFNNVFVTWYNSAYTFRYKPGWNLLNIRTADWGKSGSPSWNSPIVGIMIRINTTAASSFTVDGLATGVVAMPAVLFTFDDSMISTYTQAFNFMKTRGVRGTSYNVTDWVGGSTQMSWAQLQEMAAAGWTIGSHTKSHVHLSQLSEADQEAELLGARSALVAHGLSNSDYVAYPFGDYNADTLTAMANLGMRNGRSLQNWNSVSPQLHPLELPQRSIGSVTTFASVQGWVDAAKTRQEILVLTFHGVSASPGSNDWYPNLFQNLVDYCIQQGVPVITADDLYRLQSGGISIPAAGAQ